MPAKVKEFFNPFEISNAEKGLHRGSISAKATKVMKGIPLSCGMSLLAMDFKLNRPVTIPYKAPFPTMGFSFDLSGHSEAKSKCFKGTISTKNSQSAFNNFPDMEDFSITIGTEPMTRVGIMLEPCHLYGFIEDELNCLPKSLRNLSKQSRHLEAPLTLPMQTIAHKILSCPYQGMAKKFFLEGLALELLACKIQQLCEQESSEPKLKGIKTSDLEKVQYAAELLTGDLEKAYNLNELALSVGMCRSKLHHCFKTVFGATPFEFLRNKRLQTARDYLQEGEMNVSEAAYKVGYSSSSHFTKAFKKYFGDLPCNYCQTEFKGNK